MENKAYYGTENPKTFTFMEFGEIDTENCKKNIWGFHMHQKAYDWFMLSRYANDLLAFNAMKKMIGNNQEQDIIDHYNLEVHHDDELSLHLAKIIALVSIENNPIYSFPSFYEFGQTIFGCIEGMELYQDLIKHLNINCPKINLKDVEWYGVDISEMFNELSILFHKDYKIKTMSSQSELPKILDVFFAKGITLLYAVRNMVDLFDTIRKGRLAVFDYSFSLHNVEDTSIGSGKTVRYLLLDDFLKELKKYNEVLYVKRSNSRYIPETNKVWIDCIYSEEKTCNQYIELDTRIRKEISNRISSLVGSQRFLNNDSSPEWIRFEEYVQTIK